MKEKASIFKKLLSLVTYTNNNEETFSLRNPLVEDTKLPPYIKSKDTINENQPIKPDLSSNIKFIENSFYLPTNKGVIIRRFNLCNRYEGFLVYLDGMADSKLSGEFILKPLFNLNFEDYLSSEDLENKLNNVVEVNRITKANIPKEIISLILNGDTGIFIDGFKNYLFCETRGFEKRNIDKPTIEGSVKGSQEAFTESLLSNLSLIHRLIKDTDLIAERLVLGDRCTSNCAVIYIRDLANPTIVEEVKRRLNNISTDFILNSGILEQFIEDSPNSIIPTTLSTERPDRAVSHITDGRVAIILDNSPFAIIVPVTFFTLIRTTEDKAVKWQYGILLRLIRIFAVTVATLLPGLYIATTNFHIEMIPTALLITIAQSRENVPFPTVLEVVFMELAFELIREAGIRIPGIIGNTIGIVGALILGQAAVQANIISPILIIIISFTGLGGFSVPDFNLSYGLRIIRIIFITLGAFFGFFGISLGLVVGLALISNINSFGVPMLSDITLRKKQSSKLLRVPIWKEEFRPKEIQPIDERKEETLSRKWTNKPLGKLTNKYNKKGR
ncbi:spore germination protein [Clostridium intestinale]|uniref:spore germination protein n=1 Tax=Clostridium intestinale TaxID=36845 RepID=UPI0028ED2B57|nr:spore germination protein [Clostridium intestinale]